MQQREEQRTAESAGAARRAVALLPGERNAAEEACSCTCSCGWMQAAAGLEDGARCAAVEHERSRRELVVAGLTRLGLGAAAAMHLLQLEISEVRLRFIIILMEVRLLDIICNIK